MPTGIGTGIAGEVFKSQSGTGSSIVPIPAVFSNQYSMEFVNSSNQWLEGTSVPVLTQGGTGEWSFALWVNTAELPASNRRLLSFNVGATTGPTNTLLTIQGSPNSALQVSGPFFHSYNWLTNAPGNGSTANIINTWIHVIYRVRTSPASNNVGFVINGTIMDNKTKTIPTDYNDDGVFYIGRNGGGGYFDGKIDEVAIFNKYLTDDECLAIYNSGSPVNLYNLGISSSLKHWWRMGDPIGPGEYPFIPDEVTGGVSTNVIVNGTFDQRGPELVQNGDFSELGVEKVTDGSFPAGTTAWTAAPGWTIANGVATCSSGNDNLTQVVGAVAGKTYQISVDVNLTSGTLVVDLGYDAAEPYTESITTSGVKTFYLKAVNTNSLRFYGGAFRGSVTNISVKEVGQDWTLESSWSISTKANYDAVTTQHYLKQTMSSIAAGKTVEIQFDISDVEAGKDAFFKLEIDGTPEVVFPYTTFSEGTYTYYHTITNGLDRLNFVPLNTSTGGSFSIDNISVKEVENWTSIEGGSATVGFEEGVGVYGTTGCVLTGDAADTYIALKQSGVLTIGKLYQVNFMAKQNGGSDFNLRIDNTPPTEIQILSTTFQPYTVEFKASVANFVLSRGSGGTGGLTSSSVIVDNIEVREITGNALVMKNMTSSNIQTDVP